MVQILQGRPRRVSVAEQLLHGGLSGATEAYQQHQQDKKLAGQQAQTVKSFKDQFGVDVTGWTPEERKAYLSEAMKGENKRALMGEKQDFLSNLFGGQKPQMQKNPMENFGRQPTQQQQIQQYEYSQQEMPMQEQQQAFNPLEISDEQIAYATSMDPNLGRSLQHSKDVALRDLRAQEEMGLKQKKATPEYERAQQIAHAQAQADVNYNKELQGAEKQHLLKSRTVERLDALNRKGVTGKPYEKLLEKAGLVSLTSDGRREFAGDVKNLITDIRSILGSQFSQFEFQTILNAYPNADFSQGANSAILRNLKEFQDIRNQEFVIAKQIKQENGGKLPLGFQDQVNERLHEYAIKKTDAIKENTKQILNEEYGIKPGFVLMFDQNQESLQVPKEDVEKLKSLGATEI